MPDVSPLLALPLIQPAQAQKHVTHNAAIDRLDVLVQLVVEAFDAATPPVAPEEGAVWALGAAPSGDWAGHPWHLASWRGGAWAFVAPLPGWRAALPTGGLRVFAGGVWAGPLAAGDLQNLAGVGVNAASDATNRLAVAAAATLLSHEGAGHQLKINKAGAADTASLLFQSGWSGRAEMGLAGSDDFALKVSADGTGFATALSVAGASGAVSLPAGLRLPDGTAAAPGLRFAADEDTGLTRPGANQIGLVAGGAQRLLLSAGALQIDVPLTGTAVVQSDTDTTAGRSTTVGWMGLGRTGEAITIADLDSATLPSGEYRFVTGTSAGTPPAAVSGYVTLRRWSATYMHQSFRREEGSNRGVWTREYRAAAWTPWERVLRNHNILGTVSQSAGLPTGALIERGSNANGTYVRLADGTMRCTRHDLSAAAVSTADGAVFRSADLSWTFPSVFIAAPVVTGSADDIDSWISTGAPGTALCALRVKASVSKAGPVTVRVVAHGRWF